MRRTIFLVLALLGLAISASAQTTPTTFGAINGFCVTGGTPALVQALRSTNRLQGIIPSCQVTVYQTGTLIKAAIYSDPAGTVLTNPFTATSVNSNAPGQWLFYASSSGGYDVVLSGGIPPNVYTLPVTLTGLLGTGGGGGGGGGGTTVFNVQQYGAKCDGVTADDAALAAAEAAALSVNGQVYIQPGVTCFVTKTWQVQTSILATGATLATSSDIVVLEIGSPTAYMGPPLTPNLVLWLPDTVNLAKPAKGWNGTQNVGVKIENVNSTEIHEGHNKGFLTGTWVASINGLGTAYDKIFLGEEENDFVGLKILPEDNSGYVNQDTFIGGRLEMDGAEQPHANVTGIFTAGSNIVTGISPSTTGITTGMTIIVSPKIQPSVSAPQPSVPYATTVTSVDSSTQIHLNHPSNITTDTLIQAPVTGISLPSPNSGYSGPCTVTISAPQTLGGSTATAICSTLGGAISVTLTSGGTLYQAPPIATFVVAGAPTGQVCYPNVCTSTTIGTQSIEQPNTIIFPVQGSRELLVSHQPAGYSSNGNTFIGQSWEGDATEYQVELSAATDNTFIEGRFESGSPRMKFTSAAGYTTEYNKFIGGYGGLYLTQVVDDAFTGANDLEAPGYQFKQSGGGVRGAVMYSSQSSVQDPLIVMMGPGNGSNITQWNQSVLPCPTTGATSGQCPWYMQIGAEFIQGKQSTDIWPRYRFSSANGALSMGDGTFDLSGQNGIPVPDQISYISNTYVSGTNNTAALGVGGPWWIANDAYNGGMLVFYSNTPSKGERQLWLDANLHLRVYSWPLNGGVAPTSDTAGIPINADLYTVTLNPSATPIGFQAGDTYTATNAVQTYGSDFWSQPNTSLPSFLVMFDPGAGIKCFSAAAATTPGGFNSFWTLLSACPISGSSPSSGVTTVNGNAGALQINFSTGAGSCTFSGGTTTCSITGSGSGGGTVTTFIANAGNWPSWCVPSVTNASTTPSLSVACANIPNSALLNSSVTIGTTALSLGSAQTTFASVILTGATVNGVVLTTGGSNVTWLDATGHYTTPVVSTTWSSITGGGANTVTTPFSTAAAWTFGAAGAASQAGLTITGAPYLSGTATTNFPQIYYNCATSTAPTTWSTSGTIFGINTCASFAGNLLDLHINGGPSVFKLSSSGSLTIGGPMSVIGASAFTTPVATTVPVTISNTAGTPTGDLTQWIASSTVVAKMGIGGVFSATAFIPTGLTPSSAVVCVNGTNGSLTNNPAQCVTPGTTSTVCSATIALSGSLTTLTQASLGSGTCTGATTTDVAICSTPTNIFTSGGFTPSSSGTVAIALQITANTITINGENNTATTQSVSGPTYTCKIFR